MNPQMKRLFHTVRDGLFILSRTAEVCFANEAALRLIPAQVGRPIPNADLARLVASANAGYTALPHAQDIELGADCLVADADVVRAHLMGSPVGDDLVVILHNLTEQQFFDTALANFGCLLQRECGGQIDALGTAFDAFEAHLPAADGPVLASLREHTVQRARALFETITRLAALAALSDGEALVGDERILIADWLQRAAGHCRTLAAERRIHLLIDAGVDDLPPVYGSERWLDRVLIECVDNAVRYGAEGSDVYLSAAAHGAFVRISVRNMGVSGVPAHLRQRLLRPLYRGKNAIDADEPGLGLGLSLASRVVALHGGHLSVDQAERTQIECAVELPTGAPHHDAQQLDLVQAQRYARDLAALMQRREASH